MLFVSIEYGFVVSGLTITSFEAVFATKTNKEANQSQSHVTRTSSTSNAHYQLRQAFRFLAPGIS